MPVVCVFPWNVGALALPACVAGRSRPVRALSTHLLSRVPRRRLLPLALLPLGRAMLELGGRVQVAFSGYDVAFCASAFKTDPQKAMSEAEKAFADPQKAVIEGQIVVTPMVPVLSSPAPDA